MTKSLIPRSVIMLGGVSLFMDMSSELIHSLLPALYVTILGTSMVVVGIIEGTAEAVASVVKVFSGALSDRLGRRKGLVLIGYGLAALTKPIFPLATSAPMIFAARCLDRIGKGIRGAPRDALIADITPRQVRGAAYGLRQSLDSAGAFLGPLIAIALMVWLAGDVRLVLWFATIPAVLCMALLIFGVKEVDAPSKTRLTKLPIRASEIKRLPSAYWLLIGLTVLISLARFSEAFLTLRVMQLGLPILFTPAVILVMSLAYSLTAYPAGWLSDRIDRRVILACSLVALVVADVLLARASGIAVAISGIILWGIHMGLSQSLLSAMVADVAPERLRGTAFGLFNLVMGGVLLAASVIAGLAWQSMGSSMTFWLGAGFSIAACIALLFVPTKHHMVK